METVTFCVRRKTRGRFQADDYFTILHGEQWAFESGSLTKQVYRAGDMHVMTNGVAKQYRMPDECWALEYARGNIVSMLPFGTFDTFFSTLDFVTLYQTVAVSAKGIFRNLMRGKI
jgi:ERG2 and Sigma1 receptor like protein